MKPLQYDDFDVLIERSDEAFRAKVVNSPSGESPSLPFVPPVSDEKLELLVLRMRTAHNVRGLEADTAPDTKHFGSELFDALFHDDLLDRLRRSLAHTEVRGRGLRIRLRFSEVHELWNLPWEFLYDTESHRFLCQFATTPVVRYVEVAQPIQPLAVQGPIRMLAMISSPSDFPPLDVEKEWHQLFEALKPLEATGSLTVQRLATASLEELRHATMLGDFHVFHYIGHGGLNKQTGDGVLVLTGSDGRSQLATGHELFVMLANSPIQLAVLNSCLGARISAVDPYAGTAASLVHQGIPAVVAMQFEISDHAAIAFSRTLYEAIAYGWPIDMAVGEARRAILATSKSEWATPVLYLRAANGVLVDVTKPTRLPAPPQPTGLVGSVADTVVSLHWTAVQAGLTAVTRWEVRRDEIRIGEVTEARASDELPEPGSHEYTVVAVGTDGQRSVESAGWTAVVPSPPQVPAAPSEPRRSTAAGGRRWLLAVGAAGAIAALGVTAWLLLRDAERPADQRAGQPAASTASQEAAEPLVCSPVNDSWERIDVAPGGSAELEDETMAITLTDAWYLQQGDRWLVRLKTEAENTSVDVHSHGYYFYETMVVDGLPQGGVTCFSISAGDMVVAPGQRDIALVGFEIADDPAGLPMLLQLAGSKVIEVSPAV